MQTPSTLEDLNLELAKQTFRAGWNKHEPSLWREPRTSFVAHHWAWAQSKPGLDRAGDLISAELAERRNLFLVNPHEGNHYATLRTLVGAYQMILPGERARSHRHSPNALRYVLDAPPGTYTVVDGMRLDMRPGDVLLTPGNAWHGHGNDGDRPAYWIDVLDVPLVHQLEPMFFENWPAGFQEADLVARPDDLVFARAEWEPTLRSAATDGAGRRRHILPAERLKTMELAFEFLAAGTRTQRLQTTSNQILIIAQGEGSTQVDGRSLAWRSGDVVAIPGWATHHHDARQDTILFSVSDAPTLEKLGFDRQVTLADAPL